MTATDVAAVAEHHPGGAGELDEEWEHGGEMGSQASVYSLTTSVCRSGRRRVRESRRSRRVRGDTRWWRVTVGPTLHSGRRRSMASAKRSRQNDASIGRGLPAWRTRIRIGDNGSHRPMAAKRRSWSKITARSPASPRWLTESERESNTHGCPPRTCRSASGVTRTASRRSSGRGSRANSAGREQVTRPSTLRRDACWPLGSDGVRQIIG